jgi:prepilin-type N-terminal cleavage/methylation domain-containing protein
MLHQDQLRKSMFSWALSFPQRLSFPRKLESRSDNEGLPSRSPCAAFSLVELLVVIAVLGTLIAVLLPALGRAKDHGKLITCRANLRTVALACRAYAAEHDTLLPTEASVDNPQPELVAALTGGDYVDTPQSFYCPSEKQEDLRYSEANFAAANISYFYYSCRDRPTNRYLSNFLLKNVPWPRILNDTMPGDTWLAGDSWFSNMPTAHRFYKKGVNYATLDASVHMVKDGPRDYFR